MYPTTPLAIGLTVALLGGSVAPPLAQTTLAQMAPMTFVTQATDSATPFPDFADAARQLIYDDLSGAIYVYGYGVTEDSVAMTSANTGYVQKYNTGWTLLLSSPKYGKTTPGADTRLFNGLIEDDGSGTRYLFVSGKTDTDAGTLCGGSPLLKAPDADPLDASINGLIMKFDLSTLTLVACLIVQTVGGERDEIASMVYTR